MSGRKIALRDRLTVGPFGFGTTPIGGLYRGVREEDALAALSSAWAGGVRYFDTAPMYGYGLAEQTLGTFLRTVPRDEFTVSTKVGRVLVPGEPPAGDIWTTDTGMVMEVDYTRDGVLRSIEASLERTGLDRFDLVLIHDPDDHWRPAVEEAYPTLVELRAQGVVDAIGVGMNITQMPTRFVRETDIDVVLIAGRYSLLDREALDELFPACQEKDVAVIVGGVFNSGVLADAGPEARFNYAPATASVLDRTRQLRELCARYDVPLAAAAIQFPRRHPAVTTTLVGIGSAEQATENLALAQHPVPEELWTALSADHQPAARS